MWPGLEWHPWTQSRYFLEIKAVGLAGGLSLWNQEKKSKVSSRVEWPDDWALLQNTLDKEERKWWRRNKLLLS